MYLVLLSRPFDYEGPHWKLVPFYTQTPIYEVKEQSTVLLRLHIRCIRKSLMGRSNPVVTSVTSPKIITWEITERRLTKRVTKPSLSLILNK